MGPHLDMATGADRGQQLELITHGTPVEVIVRPVTASESQVCREGAALRELSCADIRWRGFVYNGIRRNKFV